MELKDKNIVVLKNGLLKYGAAVSVLLAACSVEKDKFLNRNFHAMATEYNVLFHGYEALEGGLEEIRQTYSDNFWDILPVERMPDKQDDELPGQSKNSNFERAEDKAVKAIQKHSMNIDNYERNPQMDEAYLLLAKARYYESRFVPALDALNYVLYKYPLSDKLHHARVWREKVNIRLENNEIAIKNLKLLLKGKNVIGQDLADANAMIAQAYINKQILDTAITTLKIAKLNTLKKEEKARYTFILGQLYEKMNYQDSAFSAFSEVIAMKRKSPRRYVIWAHAKQASQFDYAKGDTVAFLNKFDKLIEDRENRPYLDILYHQKGVFYEKFNRNELAEKYYNHSLRKASQDQYMAASNYRNIGEIHFRNAEYKLAGLYYDSTLSRLNQNSREHLKFRKKRENLTDVIKYEDIVKHNDSILRLSAMSEIEKTAYFEKYIERLKKQDEEKAATEASQLPTSTQNQSKTKTTPTLNVPSIDKKPTVEVSSSISSNLMELNGKKPVTLSGSGKQSNFYFYNPVTVSYGKKEFAKKWGSRPYGENWRQSELKGIKTTIVPEEIQQPEVLETTAPPTENPVYTTAFYMAQLPKNQTETDSVKNDLNEAYYQLGLIYKEKFKEYPLAADRLETLLQNSPEERLVLPAQYNLYKVYEAMQSAKAEGYKLEILEKYPDSRYAQILKNPNAVVTETENPETVFANMYKQLENGDLRSLNQQLSEKITQYYGDASLPKFELLKAKISGKINGVESYKEALGFVAVTYPNTDEGKQAQNLLITDIPKLEALELTNNDKAYGWKIVFPKKTEENSSELIKALKKYSAENNGINIKFSRDLYDTTSDFAVLHGFRSKQQAVMALETLRKINEPIPNVVENEIVEVEVKETVQPETPILQPDTHNVIDEAYIISSDNYSVVQIKKVFEEWIKLNN